MVGLFTFAVSALSLFSTASAAALSERSSSTFNLYAYGNNIGGNEICAKDGIAYIVEPSKINDTSVGVSPITFTTDSTSWRCSTSDSSINNELFYIPGLGSSNTTVGFCNAASNDVITSGFRFYGKLAVYLNTTTSQLESLFYAVPTSVNGVWTLGWNIQDTSSGAVAVSLRATAPTVPTIKME